MNRREFLASVAAATGAVIVSPSVVWTPTKVREREYMGFAQVSRFLMTTAVGSIEIVRLIENNVRATEQATGGRLVPGSLLVAWDEGTPREMINLRNHYTVGWRFRLKGGR